MKDLKAFTIRVYGLLHNANDEVLVLTEDIRGKLYNKFPGGGLELGEGTRECLVREFKEELDIEVEVGEHLYTTDYFIESAFKPGYQVMAIYYKVTSTETINILDTDIKSTFWLKPTEDGCQLHLESDRKVWELMGQKRRAALVKKRLWQ